jgi:hypothetical protein
MARIIDMHIMSPMDLAKVRLIFLKKWASKYIMSPLTED